MALLSLPTPQRGMIVNCHWPRDPKPEARPILIMETFRGSDGPMVWAVYGTGENNRNVEAKHILLARKDEHPAMHLECDTRFTFTRLGVLPLPWIHKWISEDRMGRNAVRGFAGAEFMALADIKLKQWSDEKAARELDSRKKEEKARHDKAVYDDAMARLEKERARKKRRAEWRQRPNDPVNQSQGPSLPTENAQPPDS